jgi:hypothetical protein
MKTTFALCLLLSTSACGGVPATIDSHDEAVQSTLTGHYSGSVDLGFITATFTLDLTEQAGGVVTGTGHVESIIASLDGRFAGQHTGARVTGTLTDTSGRTAQVSGNVDAQGNVSGDFSAGGVSGTFVADRT